ncbi:MAG TPA: hypothetical protein VK891_02615 [Euzebyales bacterium]|nr:hypothetical protein [Euzebyales bacterium]
MGVILEPHDDTTDLMVNWWNWRPTVALLLRAGVIPDDLAERMHAGVGAADVSADQALAMAEVVHTLAADLAEGERVLLDGTVTDRPPAHDHLPVEYDWYGAHRDWLRSFADFCRRSGGFTPL